MKLLRPVRNTARFGSMIHATVESVALGQATVRLANSNARLTNLPIVGSSVIVGQPVVVEMATEGHPFVRPITVSAEEITLEKLDATEEETDGTVFPKKPIYAKITRETTSFQFDAWFTEFFGEHSEYNYFEFNSTVKDTNSLVQTDDETGFTCFRVSYAGYYHLCFRAAFEGPPGYTGNDRGEYLSIAIGGQLQAGSIYQSWQRSRYNWMNPDGLYITEVHSFDWWDAGWKMFTLVGAKMAYQDPEPTIYITSPNSSPEGLYPTFEISLVVPTVRYGS